MQKRRKLLIPILATFALWYAVFMYLFDFGFVYSESPPLNKIRKVLRKMPIVYRLDRFIDPTINQIRDQNVRLSRPFDILFFPSYLQKESIPHYRIEITENDLMKIENTAKEALRQPSGRLIDEYTIESPARFFYENAVYDVDIRFRGDSITHWKKYSKKSWKVIFRNPRYFQNQHIINLTIPEERRYFDEELSKHVSRKLNLPTKNTRFVFLTLNNDNVGIYYQSEQFDADFLERRNMPEGNFYGDRFGDVSWSSYIDLLKYVSDWKKLSENPAQDANDFSDLSLFLSELRKHAANENSISLSQLIDTDSFTRWSAHSVLMGSTHQDNRHNMKLYVNPTTGLIEFIPDDVRFFPTAHDVIQACNSLDITHNEIAEIILSESALLFQRNKILWSYLNSNNIESDYAFYTSLYEAYKTAMRKGLRVSTILQFEREYRRTLSAIQPQYHAVMNLLTYPPQPSVHMQKNGDVFTITITFSGPTGFDVAISTQNEKTTQIETSINERILPQLDPKNKSQCIPYKQTSRTYTINCPQCTKDDISIQIKNAITESVVEPLYSYD